MQLQPQLCLIRWALGLNILPATGSWGETFLHSAGLGAPAQAGSFLQSTIYELKAPAVAEPPLPVSLPPFSPPKCLCSPCG